MCFFIIRCVELMRTNHSCTLTAWRQRGGSGSAVAVLSTTAAAAWRWRGGGAQC